MTMKQSTNNVSYSKPWKDANTSGYIWYAPLGTDLPTDPTLAPASPWTGLGYITDDGLTEPNPVSAGDGVNDAGGDQIAVGDPTFAKAWEGSFAEALNPDVLKVIWGESNVTVNSDGSIHVKEGASSPKHYAVMVKELGKNGRRILHTMEDASFVLNDDITHDSSDIMAIGFHIDAYPGSDGFTQHDWYEKTETTTPPSGGTQSVDEPAEAPVSEPEATNLTVPTI